jgi:hypothetical protein
VDIDLAWFPLVLRERPPGGPLEARVAELELLAAPAAQETRPGRIARACEVLNKAALIASDCGLPTLAHALCHRQYELFEEAKPWPSWEIKLALQPLLNIARQHIREGNGDNSLALLESLYAAARARTSVTFDGHLIDFGPLIATPEDHKTLCTLIWAALLADGTRSLTQAGRWSEAAARAAAHRGIGTRLLDGRQVAIIARLHENRPDHAAELVEQSQITEPWEYAVQNILRVLCRSTAGSVTPTETAAMLATAHALLQTPHRPTTAARTRIGIVALDLAETAGTDQGETLLAALNALAVTDAYAAQDVLTHRPLSPRLTASQSQSLHNLVRACGLRRGTIPSQLRDQLMAAVAQSTATLTRELEHVDLDSVLTVRWPGAQWRRWCCGWPPRRWSLLQRPPVCQLHRPAWFRDHITQYSDLAGRPRPGGAASLAHGCCSSPRPRTATMPR